MKTKFFVILAVSILAAACVPPRKGLNISTYEDFTGKEPAPVEDEGYTGVSSLAQRSSYGDAVVVVASRRISLGRDAGESAMNAFRASLDAAYLAARRAYGAPGFTYSLSPVGAVNPMSDMEVQCVISEDSAQDLGPQTCNLFFNRLKEELAQNETL